MEYRLFIKSVAPTSKLLLVFTMVAIYAEVVYQLPIKNSLIFILAVFCIFYVPGDLILNAFNIEIPFEGSRFIYSTAIGILIVSISYSMWRYFDIGAQYLYLPFICTIFVWVSSRRYGRLSGSLKSLSISDFSSLCVLIVIILLMLNFTHFSDIKITTEGFKFRVSHSTETVFHQGLINALIDNYPLAALYASGITNYFHYHIGMHLHIELIHRLFDIPTIELIYYYFAFLYFFLLSALSYTLTRSIGGNWISALFAGILIFGSDFSYIIGIVNSLKAPIQDLPVKLVNLEWDLLNISGVYNLFTYNGIIPGLLSFLVSVILFKQYCRVFSCSTLVLLAIVVVSAYQFKYSLGLQLNLAFVFIGMFMLVAPRYRNSGLILAGLFSFLILVMLGFQQFISGGIGNNVVKFIPFNMFSSALEKNGLLESPFYLKPLFFIMYFILALGVRYLGYHILINTQWNIKHRSWSVIFIFIFFLSGYSMAELFIIGVEGGHDNSSWFVIQGLFAAWILVFYFFVKMQGNMKRHLLAVTAVVILAFPSTIQLLAVRDKNYIEFNKDDMDVVEFIKSTKPDSIFLHPVRPLRPSLASNFGGRSSVLSDYFSFIMPFLIKGSGREDLEDRFNDVELFFTENSSIMKKNEILEKYKVDFIYCWNILNACKTLESSNHISLVLSNVKLSVYSVAL